MDSAIMRRRRRASGKPPESDTEYFSDKPASTSSSDADSSDSPPPFGPLPPPSADGANASDEVGVSSSGRAWSDYDLSVALALLSPVVNWLTGSDHVKNIFLIFLLVFYLHQIVEVPWSLYLASRPRHAPHTQHHDQSSTEDKYRRAALSELHALEIFYLTLSILSPFLGATLLRTVVISFSGKSAVSWFSLSLFVLATGRRPWKHAIDRLRQRTSDLHTIIHYPPLDSQKMDSLMDKIAHLEAELNSLRRQSKSFNSDMYDHVEDAIEMVEIAARRHEKKAEASKTFVDARLVKLEQNVEALLERMEIRADRPALYRIMAHISTVVSASIEQLSPILPTWVITRWRGNVSRSPRSSPKLARSRSSIKLETIPEVSTFQPKSTFQPSRYLHIPGLGLALRVCYLATLPLRHLAGQIYTSCTHAPSS